MSRRPNDTAARPRARRGSTPARGWLAAMTIALALAVAACGGGEGQAQDGGQGATTLTFLGFYQPEEVQPLLDAFEASHPDIAVDYQSVPFADLNEVVQSRLGPGDATPDVYTADQPRIPALVARGFLLDLTEEVDDPNRQWLPATVEASSINERLYAMPLNSSTQLLYYNRELLEQAGIEPPPTSPDGRWTWEQLRDAAVTAQEAGAQSGFQFEQVSRVYQILPLPESLDGGNGVTGPDSLTPAITNDGWIEALEFYGQLYADGISARGIAPEQTSEAFAAGDIAFFVGGPWNIGEWDQQGLDFEYGVAAHPYFEGGDPVTPTGSWSWGVNPNSENIDAAVEFVRYATATVEGTTAMLERDPNIPANRDVLPDYLSRDLFQRGDGGTTVGELMQYELENTARIRPRTPGFIQFEEIVGRALEDIRNGQPVEPSLQSASERLAEAWARLAERLPEDS